MRAFEIADEDRTAYHAAASMAANFLVTLESAAARLAATAGVERGLLVPLVRAAVERWASRGRRLADRARSPAATRPPWRATARPSPSARPTCSSSTTSSPGATRAVAAMRTVRTVAEVRAALREARRAERVIGLVPTMGALHDGHL